MRQLTEYEASFSNEILADRPPRWYGETTHVNFDKKDPADTGFASVTDERVPELVLDTYTIEYMAERKRDGGYYWEPVREI